MAAHVLDYDDNYHPASTHASAVLVPALLALGEEHGFSGARLLDAYIVGTEIQAAVAQGVNRIHYDSGWHGTSTVGAIGTAAACARLLGLDAESTANAISLGASMASGTKVQFGSMAKPYHAGMAAQNAVLAAGLAANGVTGRDNALEGRLGFRALYAGPRSPGWRNVLPGLGDPLYLEKYGLAPKLYPCCGSAHRTLDGLLDLKRRHRFGAGDVAAVETLVGFTNKRNLMYPDPQNEMGARFSMHYCVAVALLFGRLSLADFTPRAVGRSRVRRLLALTHMRGRPQKDENNDPAKRKPVLVTVKLKDGRVLKTQVRYARGTVFRPFDDGDLDDKFHDCVSGFLAPGAIAAAERALARLENLKSVRGLTRHLVFEAGADRGERFERRPRA
jgi:2-methylcitrate dehydratase PrpD